MHAFTHHSSSYTHTHHDVHSFLTLTSLHPPPAPVLTSPILHHRHHHLLLLQQFAYISNRIKCIKVMTGNGPFLA